MTGGGLRATDAHRRGPGRSIPRIGWTPCGVSGGAVPAGGQRRRCADNPCTAFLAGALGDFLAADFLAIDSFATAFFATAFFATAFPAVFVATGFLAAAFLAATFFVGAFFAVFADLANASFAGAPAAPGARMVSPEPCAMRSRLAFTFAYRPFLAAGRAIP
jgi:hypothetical protein